MTMTLSGWIACILAIFCAVGILIIPILTLINYHRTKNGKDPLYKGRVRRIVIVNKRVTEYEYSNAQYSYSRFGASDMTGEPDGTARNTSVDFRIVGRKILYTKSVDEDIFDLLYVGKTYKVRIRFDRIEKIYM